MTMALFGVLVSLGVLLRILSLFFLVPFADCDAIIQFANGAEGHLGVAVCIMICAGFCGIVQLFVMRSGILSKNWGWTDAALGTVNLCLVFVVSSFGALHLAYANSDTSAGFLVNRVSSQLVEADFFGPVPFDFTAYDLRRDMGWEPLSATEAVNLRAGLVYRNEVVKTCFTEEFVRANHRARFPDLSYEEPHWLNQQGWVFYDLDGTRLSFDEAGNRLDDLRPQYPGRDTAPDGTPLLTYNEILAIVVEEWAQDDALRLPESDDGVE